MAIVKTNYEIDGEPISYEILPTEYYIYKGGKRWIWQYEPDCIPHPELGLEGSCLKDIEDLCNRPEPAPSAEDQLRADVDYIAAMTGVELV